MLRVVPREREKGSSPEGSLAMIIKASIESDPEVS